MRISDWSSDVCSSVLTRGQKTERQEASGASTQSELMHPNSAFRPRQDDLAELLVREVGFAAVFASTPDGPRVAHAQVVLRRSEEHTPELQSLMRHTNAGLCLQKQKQHILHTQSSSRQVQ